MSKNITTLKSQSRVNQGHWTWYHSIYWVWLPISVLYNDLDNLIITRLKITSLNWSCGRQGVWYTLGFPQLWKPVVVKVRSSKVARMLGFYVLLEDLDASVIIALALHSALLQLGFLKVMIYAILLISPGHWLQSKTQQPIGVVASYNSCQWFYSNFVHNTQFLRHSTSSIRWPRKPG